MAQGVELAVAYVSLALSGRGLLDKVKAELGGPLDAAARNAGDRAGDSLSRGVSGSLKGLERSVKGDGKRIGASLENGVSSGLAGIGPKLAGVFAAVQVGQFLKGAVTAAADTAESVSKLTVLVGDSADGLDDWAKTTGEAFGISRREALSAAGTFATFFRGIGKSQEDAAAMSRELTELAADIASFSNTSPERAIEALGAALRGESEPIRAYGVLLDDATLKTRAFNMGLVATTKEALSPAIRVQAAYAEILAQTGNAQGDFARTSDGLAGSQKQLAAQFKDAQAQLGEALLPAMSAAVGVAKDLLPAVSGMAETFAGLAGAAGEAAAPVAGVLGSLVTSDLGSAAITAGAVAFAIGKIGEASKAAAVSLSSLSVANPALLGLSVAVGATAAVYLSFKKDAAEAEEQQDRLSEAFTNAADPAFVLVDNLTKVVDALKKTKDASGGAADGVEKLADPLNLIKELDQGVVGTLGKVGVGVDEVSRALIEGRIDELVDRFYESSKRLDGTITNQQGMTRYADGVEDAALALTRLGDNAEEARKQNADAAKAQLEAAVFIGSLEQTTLDSALAASSAADETGRWIDAAAALTPALESLVGPMGETGGAAAGAARSLGDVGAAAADSVGGVGDAAGAAEELADRQDLAKKAADKHKQAIQDLNADIDDFITKTFEGQRSADEWTKSLTELVDQVSGQQLDVQLSTDERGKRAEFDALEAQSKADLEVVQSSGASTEEIAAAREAAAASLAAARENLGLASEANLEAFDLLVSTAQADVEALIRQGAPLTEVAATSARLAGEIRAKAAEIGVSLEGTAASLEGNSAAALANRDLFDGFLNDAKADIEELVNRPGTSIEDVTRKAQELATKVGDVGVAMGLSGPALDTYVAGILGIADTANDANAALAALPTDLALNITYTLGLNAEEFRAQLLEASRAFQDELSASYVELGIIEVPGASFALPRRAQGGPVRAGEMYWVGEHGPEPFVPDVNGTVIANDKVSVLSGGGGGLQVGTINVTEAASPAHVVDEINARLGWMLTTRNER